MTPSTQISLSIKRVSRDTPIKVITAKEGMGKTLKHQKWIVTNNSGSFQAIVEGDNLRKGIPHEAQETENWGTATPLFTLEDEEAATAGVAETANKMKDQRQDTGWPRQSKRMTYLPQWYAP